MPVYNTDKFVGEAIQSILDQTFTDFEFIIIDDGSTDKSWKIISSFAQKDSRIKALQNEKNRGISYTRNRLIELTTTNYIAVQDSDDVSLPTRLWVLYALHSTHPNVAAIGGNNFIIDENGIIVWYRLYSNNIKNVILKKSPMCHPASMFKKQCFILVGWYNSTLNYGEDYDLWLKMFAQWYDIINIDQYLLKYRVRTWQTKLQHLKQTIKNTISIQQHAIREYALLPTRSDKIYHFLERCLLWLPNTVIFWLFKQIEYHK